MLNGPPGAASQLTCQQLRPPRIANEGAKRALEGVILVAGGVSWTLVELFAWPTGGRLSHATAVFAPHQAPNQQALALSVYNTAVERTVRIFASFKDADAEDASADAALTPEQRLKIVLELRDRRHPDALEQRLARVSRIVELERS
jgi:hypothetical protein